MRRTWYLGHHWPRHCRRHASANQMGVVRKGLPARGTDTTVLTLKEQQVVSYYGTACGEMHDSVLPWSWLLDMAHTPHSSGRLPSAQGRLAV